MTLLPDTCLYCGKPVSRHTPKQLASECFPKHIASLRAEIERKDAALRECEAQFSYYAAEHAGRGSVEKAATNRRFAELACAACSALTPARETGETK